MSNRNITNISFKTEDEKAAFDKLAKFHGFSTIKGFVLAAVKDYDANLSNPLFVIYKVEAELSKLLKDLEKRNLSNTQVFESTALMIQIIARLEIVREDPQNWRDFITKKGYRFNLENRPFLDNELT